MRAWLRQGWYRRWFLGVAALVAAVGVAGLATTGGAAAAGSYPVPYGLQAGAVAETVSPGSAPPGSNDWACTPSPRHPNPVVLVHGFTANQTEEWQTVAPLLANEGWCVFSLTYGTTPGAPFPADQVGGLTRMQDSAAQLRAFVDRVLATTHASRVDLVGGSEGTVMPRWYIKHLGGGEQVQRFVALAPLWQGTNVAGLATADQLSQRFGVSVVSNGVIDPGCGSCRQMLHGSDYLADVNAAPAFDPRITYTSIVTRYDELVVPYTSGIAPKLPNTTTIVLQDQCPVDAAEHAQTASAADPTLAADTLNALDPQHPRPVPCQLIPPVR